MVVRLRLARFGRYKFPFYRIYAADHRSPRDGKHIEILGHYDPIPQKDGNKHVGLHLERIKYWLSVGAQPSKPVARILAKAGEWREVEERRAHARRQARPLLLFRSPHFPLAPPFPSNTRPLTFHSLSLSLTHSLRISTSQGILPQLPSKVHGNQGLSKKQLKEMEESED